MRKFFGKFVSVTLAAVVIAMFALSSDDKWCSRVDKAFDESALGSFLNESKAGYGRYATGLPGQAASVLADSGKNGENGENSGTEQDIGQTADTTPTHRAADRDYEETDKISDGIRVEGVYACGRLTGIYEQTEGVLVVNTTEVTDEDGKKVNPADKKVQCGDYILSVNGRTVADKEELSEAVNDIMKEYDERHEDKSTVNIKFLRGGEKMSADITPVRMDDGRYYMGIWVKDIENILALRGDRNPNVPAKEDFLHASDLIKYIKDTTGDQFCIAGACYPDIHPEAADKVDDIKNLKKKVDAGAELLLSQLFFDNDTFFNFAEDCRLAGINVPVIPGIMPCINAAQIQRMVTMCGAKFPEKFQKIVHRYGDNKAALFDAGMSYCESQIIELLANDVEGIHLYTMNNVRVAKRLTEGIKNLI